MQVRFRPLPIWPHPVTRSRRWHPFSASWQDTLNLLERELGYLRGSNVIIAGGWREGDIRLDGLPKGNAPEPGHPGVELIFDSKHGRLTYATDVCSHWQDNVRSIAKGLEALRAVNRFGVAIRGQQYAGWKALPTGSGDPTTTAEAWEVLLRAAGLEGRPDLGITEVFRLAAKRIHPDKGGDPEVFRRVEAARRLLTGAA